MVPDGLLCCSRPFVVVLEAMDTWPVRKVLAPIVPYLTIGPALLVFHSAWLAILSYHAGMIAVISLSGKGFAVRQVLRGKGYVVPTISALAGFGAGLIVLLLWPIVSAAGDVNSYLRSIGLDERAWPAFLSYFVLVNPSIEEYYWRGCLASDTRGATLNDMLFSGYHLIVLAGQTSLVWLTIAFVGLTAVAWFWRQMNRVNGGLVASIASHITADLACILTIYYMSMR